MVTSSASPIPRIRQLPSVRRAEALVRDTDARTVQDQVELTAIPAPPFREGARGERMAELMEEAGLHAIRRDEVGNVLGHLPAAPGSGRSSGPERDGPAAVVLSAHLDTVFPPEVEIRVRRNGARLEGPGISDNGRGLAALVSVARALASAGVPLSRPLHFVATVGEEGAGDLRGVKHLFRQSPDGIPDAVAFVALDGAGMDRVVHRGVGSVRLRATARGPGGHSWVDWGQPNPMAALGRSVARVLALAVPQDPRATLTVARWGGGTSVNAIPCEAWVELDLRSEDAGHLEGLHRGTVRALEEGVGEERSLSTRNGVALELSVETIGERPVGRTDPEATVVRCAVEATRLLGGSPLLVSSSTDANLPMSLGVPAIALGAGGEAGKAHTEGEWYRNRGGPDGIVRALLTVVATAGVEEAG